MSRPFAVIVLIAAVLIGTSSAERIGRAFYDGGLPGLAGLVLAGPVWRGAVLYAQGRFAEAAGRFENAPFAGAAYDEGTALARAGDLDRSESALNEALDRDPNDEDARYNLALVEALREKLALEDRDATGFANASASAQKRARSMADPKSDDVNSTGDGAAGDRDSGTEAKSPGGAQVTKTGRARQSSASAEQNEARGSVGAAEGLGRKGGDTSKVAQSFDQMMKLPKMSFTQQAVNTSMQWLQTIPDDPGKYLRLKLAAERTVRAERGVAAPEGTDQW